MPIKEKWTAAGTISLRCGLSPGKRKKASRDR